MGFESESIGAFLSSVASENVSPAGGTCAAVVGAVGASLCEMACLHTVADARTDGESVLVETGERLASRRVQLLRLADSDAAVADGLSGGFDDDRARLKRATGVPLTIAESCLHVLDAATVVTAEAKGTTVPDARTGALFADAALRAAVLIVRTNAGHASGSSFADETVRRAVEIESAAEDAMDEIGSTG